MIHTVAVTYIEDITWPRVDMNFIFKCSNRYLMIERNEWVRHRIEHEKIKIKLIRIHKRTRNININIFMTFLTIF